MEANPNTNQLTNKNDKYHMNSIQLNADKIWDYHGKLKNEKFEGYGEIDLISNIDHTSDGYNNKAYNTFKDGEIIEVKRYVIYKPELKKQEDDNTICTYTTTPLCCNKCNIQKAFYIGQLKDSKLHGKGKLMSHSPNHNSQGNLIFEGNFKNGKKDGQGRQYHTSHSFTQSFRYEGIFENDKLQGYAEEYSCYNKKLYDGMFVDGKYQGGGVEYEHTGVGVKYSGNFKNGKYECEGTEYHLDSEQVKYTGNFKNGLYDGSGKEFHKNGVLKYNGNYKNGKFDDYGKQHNDLGKCLLEGFFVKGKLEGDGSQYYDVKQIPSINKMDANKPAPQQYEGMFQNGNWNGEGVLYYHEPQHGHSYNRKKKYEGNFKDGMFEGIGKKYYKSFGNQCVKYEGNFKNGKLDGEGKVYHSNRNLWLEGVFEKGKLQGNGKEYHDNAKLRYEGEFNNGVFDGKGKEYFQNGVLRCDGEFKSGLVQGYTIMYNKFGNMSHKGNFYRGKLEQNGSEYHYDGQQRFEGFFKQGHFTETEGVEYHRNGNERFKGNFVYGKPDGIGKQYYDNGQINYEGFFKFGKLEGEGKEYHHNGQLKYEGCFENGSLYCEFGVEYNKIGKCKYKGKYVRGLLLGKGQEYYENGQLKYDGHFQSQKYTGKGKEYYQNGQLKYEGYFAKGKSHSDGKYYRATGEIFQEGKFFYGRFVKGVERGYENAVKYEKYFINDGAYDTIMYPGITKGDLSSQGGQLIYGKKFYYILNYNNEAPILKYEGYFKNGQIHDIGVKVFHPSGRLSSIGNFVEGVQYGYIRNYNLSGKLEGIYHIDLKIITEDVYQKKYLNIQGSNIFIKRSKQFSVKYYNRGSIKSIGGMGVEANELDGQVSFLKSNGKIYKLYLFDNGEISKASSSIKLIDQKQARDGVFENELMNQNHEMDGYLLQYNL